jgi:hypothetical protein
VRTNPNGFTEDWVTDPSVMSHKRLYTSSGL